MPAAISLDGQRFGKIVAVRRAGNAGPHATWECVCDCGKTKIIRAQNLRRGDTKSCGCASKSERWRETVNRNLAAGRPNGTTNRTKHPEYSSWSGMISRCHRERDKDFRYYGARGVHVCDRWRNSFEAFLADMGPKPSQLHSIDRINSNGNYEPGNCRWATMAEQNRNRGPFRKRRHSSAPAEASSQ